jgi:aryl-alcohol dehydrogenase-like predicted oxidoreductase
VKYKPLGRTDLKVSEICLGSMTWGTQNTEAEGHAQLDYAVGQGVNFIDTAEMYPTTPSSPDTQGRTEDIIGTWLAQRGRREDVVIASKITGLGPKWIRGGAGISASEIPKAVGASLKRLKTDYIDLYQLHWPNRGSYHFRQLWGYDPTSQSRTETRDHILETLQALQTQIDAGTVRHVGLSNESCWGTAQFLEIAEAHGLPRMVSIQNEYSLMQRIFDWDLAELSHNEDVGLLAYSPLAAGALTGKYRGTSPPAGSRRTINDDLFGRYTSATEPVFAKYLDVARRHSLDPAQMALAFCLTRPFMTSVIIGATSLAQLKSNIAATDLRLSQAILDDLNAVHRQHPIPF